MDLHLRDFHACLFIAVVIMVIDISISSVLIAIIMMIFKLN